MMNSQLAYPARLEEILEEFDGLTRPERMEMLIDYSDRLPEVPERLKQEKDPDHQVHECRTPTWVYVEPSGESANIYVEVEESAPTIRAIADIIIEGSKNAPRRQILAIPDDIPVRVLTPEIGMQRIYGLSGLINNIKREVARIDEQA